MSGRQDERTPLLAAAQESHLQRQRALDKDRQERESAEDLSDPQRLSKRTRNLILASVWLGVGLGALDTTLTATLITDVSATFHASNQASWLGTSYLLSTATFTPLYGRLANIWGRRNACLVALTLFTIGTLFCGLAPSMNTLIAARLLAGSGGGGMMTVSSIVASDVVPLKSRGYFQGLANICFGLGAGLGAPVGGLVTDTVGWRWAFLFQVPLLVLAGIFVFIFMRYVTPGQGKSKKEMIKRVDYGGSLTLIVTIGSLLFALSYKNNESLPWSSPFVWGFLIVFVVFLGLFMAVETYLAPEPVMPLRIMATRNGFFVNLTNLLVSFVAFSVLYFFPQVWEAVRLQSASEAGAHLLPNSVALSCGSVFAGWVMRKTGKYSVLTSVCCLLPVFSLVAIAMLDEHSGFVHSWFSIIPSGFGFSATITSLLIALIAAVDREDMAVATGTTYLFRYVGQVTGVAISASLLQAVLTSQLTKRITGPGAAEIIDRVRHESTAVKTLPPGPQAAAVQSYVRGLRAVFILNACVAFCAFLCTLCIKEYPLPSTFNEQQEADRQRRSGTSTPAQQSES